MSEIAVEDYDLVIIGTGEGSKFLAWTQARKGQRVAVVERRWIGGACPNVACLPSKNVIHSAKVASLVRRAEEFGIKTSGFSVDMKRVTDRKRMMVSKLVDIHVKNFETSGTELMMGSGRFVGPRTVEVSLDSGKTRRVRGRNVVIGTGTHATIADVPGLADAKPLTHIEALELDQLPARLVILGGGYIGLEFAQAMRRLGSHVTVIEQNDRILRSEDADVQEALDALMADEGIEIVTRAKITRVSGTSGSAVQVHLEGAVIEGTHLLVAAGRTPNTKDLGLENAGVELTERGYLAVDNRLQTTAPGVWGIGDVAGSPQFTHISFDDYRVVAANIENGNRTTTDRLVPYCLFTDPELARVGLSEKEAKAKGLPYRLFSIPMAADLRTRTLSETRGFMKALVATDSDRILGFTVFGVDGGEIMSAMQLAMIGNLPFTAVRDAILTHPTLTEGLIVLFSATPKEVKP